MKIDATRLIIKKRGMKIVFKISASQFGGVKAIILPPKKLALIREPINRASNTSVLFSLVICIFNS